MARIRLSMVAMNDSSSARGSIRRARSIRMNLAFSALGGFKKQTRKYEDNSDLEALFDGFQQLSGQDRTEFLVDNVNIPATVNFLAGLVITAHGDCCSQKSLPVPRYGRNRRVGTAAVRPRQCPSAGAVPATQHLSRTPPASTRRGRGNNDLFSRAVRGRAGFRVNVSAASADVDGSVPAAARDTGRRALVRAADRRDGRADGTRCAARFREMGFLGNITWRAKVARHDVGRASWHPAERILPATSRVPVRAGGRYGLERHGRPRATSTILCWDWPRRPPTRPATACIRRCGAIRTTI